MSLHRHLLSVVRTGILAAICSATLTGCLQPDLVPCGDLSCPAGSVCVSGGCATTQQVAACAGVADGQACTLDGTSSAYCVRGVCRPSICGDGVVDPGERCDDGDTISGDGCSAHCDSDESCGNGIVDYAAGEQCDDGNVVDRDGCRSDCTIPRCGDGIVDTENGEACDEGAANSNAPGATCRTNCQPQRCGDGALDPGEACDDGNLIPGDGCSGDCVSLETCGNGYLDAVKGEQCDDDNLRSQDGCSSTCSVELDVWRDETPGPFVMRNLANLAWDPVNQMVMFFGGSLGSTFYSDTWEWNGSNWIKREMPAPPANASTGFLVTDTALGRVMLVALGVGMWTFDGVSWVKLVGQVPPPGGYSPGAVAYGTIAYDAGRDRIVLYGVIGHPPTETSVTWEWDGTAWTMLAPSTSPTATETGTLGYDPIGGRVLLFSDGGSTCFPCTPETWAWDGTDWSLVPATGQPSLYQGSWTVSPQGKLVFAGTSGSSAQTWTLTGTAWAMAPTATPVPYGYTVLDSAAAGARARRVHGDGHGRDLGGEPGQRLGSAPSPGDPTGTRQRRHHLRPPARHERPVRRMQRNLRPRHAG